MRFRPFLFAVGLVILLGAAGPVRAQGTLEESTAVLEAEDLGISLARIQQRLDRLPDGEESRRTLRLNYYVQVYARAPALNLFNDFDVHNSPVPYGVPMHSEMLRAMRPNEHVPDVVNLNPILGWTWRALQ